MYKPAANLNLSLYESEVGQEGSFLLIISPLFPINDINSLITGKAFCFASSFALSDKSALSRLFKLLTNNLMAINFSYKVGWLFNSVVVIHVLSVTL